MNVKSSILHAWIHWKTLFQGWSYPDLSPTQPQGWKPGICSDHGVTPCRCALVMLAPEAQLLLCLSTAQQQSSLVTSLCASPAQHQHPDYTNLSFLNNMSTFIQHRHFMKRPFPDACITHWLILEDISYYFSTVFYLDFTSALVPIKEGKRESKQGRKKGRFGAEIVAILRTQKEDGENYLSTHFNSQILDLALHSRSVFDLLRALL